MDYSKVGEIEQNFDLHRAQKNLALINVTKEEVYPQLQGKQIFLYAEVEQKEQIEKMLQFAPKIQQISQDIELENYFKFTKKGKYDLFDLISFLEDDLLIEKYQIFLQKKIPIKQVKKDEINEEEEECEQIQSQNTVCKFMESPIKKFKKEEEEQKEFNNGDLFTENEDIVGIFEKKENNYKEERILISEIVFYDYEKKQIQQEIDLLRQKLMELKEKRNNLLEDQMNLINQEKELFLQRDQK